MENEEKNWSEQVENLVDTGNIDEAISLLETENPAPDLKQLSCALTDLANLYASRGFSLKSDELQTRAFLVKQRAQPSSRDVENVGKKDVEKITVSGLHGSDCAATSTCNVTVSSDDDHIYPTPTIGKKRLRLPNFSIDEDVNLCKSWIKISEDDILGVLRTSGKYWTRITNEFKVRNRDRPRSLDSVKGRWQFIQREVSKFMGYLAQEESTNQSGTTSRDVMVQVRAVYQSVEGHPFAFDHCYLVLKDNLKWHKSLETKTKNSKRMRGGVQIVAEGSTDATNTPVFLDKEVSPFVDTTDVANTPVILDKEVSPFVDSSEFPRPDGVKKQKQKKKKACSEMSKMVEGFVNRVEQRMDRQDKLLETSLKLQDRKYEIMSEKNRIARMKEETKIMAMDTTVLPPERAVYFKSMQDDIIRKWNDQRGVDGSSGGFSM